MGMKEQPFDPRDHEAFVREIDPKVYDAAAANLPRGVIPRRRGMTWRENLAEDISSMSVVSVTSPPGRYLVSPPVAGITTTVSGSCTVNESVAATLSGEIVWKVTATSVGASQYVELHIPTQNDFSATDSTVEMYLDDPTKITTIAQYLGNTGYVKNVVSTQSSINTPTNSRAPRMKGWNAFQTTKSQWTKSGSLSGLEIGDQLWTIGKIRVFLAADVTTTFYLRAVHVNASRKSRIAITWDDGYESVTRLGAPLLDEYRLCSTMAIIQSRVGDTANGFASLGDLQAYVAAGNTCCPHGPTANSGNGNLFSVHANNAARLADVNIVRDYIVVNNLARRGAEDCYVWPQGVFCESTTDLSFLDMLLQNGFTLGRGITATINQYSRAAAMAAHNSNRMVLNIVGHSWSADEATNVATVISRIQAAAADGYDCILMLHKVVGEDAAAASTEISINRLREICAAIATLVAAGTMQDVLLPDLAR